MKLEYKWYDFKTFDKDMFDVMGCVTKEHWGRKSELFIFTPSDYNLNDPITHILPLPVAPDLLILKWIDFNSTIKVEGFENFKCNSGIQNWTSVANKNIIPKNNNNYLVYVNVCNGWFEFHVDFYNNGWLLENASSRVITHWLEIPALPGEE